MKTYDKASWHIDGGENPQEVIERFHAVFLFLRDKMMLTEDGIETLEYGMDSSASLNSTMVTAVGKDFLDRYYDEVLAPEAAAITQNLLDAYEKFKANA